MRNIMFDDQVDKRAEDMSPVEIKEALSHSIDVFDKTKEKLINVFASYLPFIVESLRVYSLILEEKLAKLLPQDRYTKAVNIRNYAAKNGWSFPSEIFEELLDDNEYNEETLQLTMQKLAADVNNIFEKLQYNNYVPHGDIIEAIETYEEQHFKSCALLLMFLIEQILSSTSLALTAADWVPVGKNVVDVIRNNLRQIPVELLSALDLYSALSCLDVMYESQKRFKISEEVIKRNLLFHGLFKRNITKEDCIKLFYLYYCLSSDKATELLQNIVSINNESEL